MVAGYLRQCHGLFAFILSFGALLVMATAALAQSEPKSVSIPEVNRILTDPSQTAAQAMRFAGVVTFVSRAGDFNLQDGTAGIFVEPPNDHVPVKPGDRVEVTATIGYRTSDALSQSFFLHADRVKVVGTAGLPEPKGIWLAEALRGAASGQRVWVEGVVMQATVSNGVVQLHLTDHSGWAVLNVHDWRPGTTTRGWWGAKLRVTCTNVGRGHTALRATSSDDIAVTQPGTDGCFDAPLADFKELQTHGRRPDRLRVLATVLGTKNDDLFLRSEDGVAFRSSLLAPFPPTTPQPHPLELLAPRLPGPLQPGDRVELVGSPLGVEPSLQMSFASVRVLGPGPLPKPASVGTKNPAAFVGDLVTLSGRVRWHDPGKDSHLEIDSNGTPVHVTAPAGASSAEKWQPGDVIQATGLLLPGEQKDRPPVLQVLADSRIQRLSDSSSNWRALTPLARQWFALLAAGLGVALAGTWWLQRLVRQRTAALAGANEALQAEVAVREKAEAELARALEQERELGELKSRFVSMVSHEFRTPLGITMSAVELLQHYQDRLPDDQRVELLDDIQRSTKNMADLMEQVLLLGRVEAGRLGFRPQLLDLETLARKLTDELLSATHRRCPIQWSSQGSLAGARGDESLLRHIVSNLLSNAVKYSPEGAEVSFAAVRDGADAVLTVADRGIGIPHEERARLFEAFHRCGNVGEIPGTGLGLVIVKRCVDLHGGSIDLESEPGRGTTFIVRLPLWPEPADSASVRGN